MKTQAAEFRLLLKSVPSVPFVLFVLALFSMNILANKSISLPIDWLALDCGILVSWFVFLMLDILTKYFGPKAATALSYFAAFLHLCLCGVFYLVGKIPGVWGEAIDTQEEGVINAALDNTFGGTWYIILGSVIAFSLAATVNNFLHSFVSRLFKDNGRSRVAFVCSSYISTAVSQLTDNFVFSLLVGRVFFGWSLVQCLTCSLFGMLAELICEGLFVWFGYRICENWKKNKVGEAYLCRKDKTARE